MAKSKSSSWIGPNGPKGLGKEGKGSSLAAGQGKKRYSRKRINTMYSGGK